jgi:5-methylcytosine-specific restriction endonuclease McrA
MTDKTNSQGKSHMDDVVAQAVRERKNREKTYRERALKLFDHVCGRCAREFAGKRLRELTVHHRDHNHDNNPPDGSNWELLCIYCHENEHSRDLVQEAYSSGPNGDDPDEALTHQPFAGLEALLKKGRESDE